MRSGLLSCDWRNILADSRDLPRQLMITFGILVAYCISIGTRYLDQNGASWRIVVMLNCLWALILGVGFIFAPESPRWLFGQGRPEAAEKSLARIRGVKVEDNDYTVRTAYYEMEEDVKRSQGKRKFGWIDCFRPKNKMLCESCVVLSPRFPVASNAQCFADVPYGRPHCAPHGPPSSSTTHRSQLLLLLWSECARRSRHR